MLGIKRNAERHLPYSVSRPLTRVELHVHLDGALRAETIWDLAKQKNIQVPGGGSLRGLQEYLVVKRGVSLADFLSRFDIIVAVLRGDLKAIERVAYEVVEDKSRQGVAYFEARYCPYLILPENLNPEDTKKWVWKVTEAMIKGLEKGQADFKTRGNLIATCIRNNPTIWYTETIELAADKNFHRGRIVGVDLAGVGDGAPCGIEDSAGESKLTCGFAVDFCKAATELGIARSIHAGESGGPDSVTIALDNLNAMRIGHGYRSVDDRKVYDRVRKERVHLECCPWSSILTGSCSPTELPHPIVQFFQDDFNVSINTDDPTCTGTDLDDEFRLLHSWGLSEAHFIKASFNAARSVFLPENEKADLIQHISKNIGCTL